ncbi:hypothetical protein PO124_11445 [Bacillus licheniformis]|nr:hypothetical protein [Bacillus licheniformis]
MNRGGAETMIMNIYRHTDRRHIQFDLFPTGKKRAITTRRSSRAAAGCFMYRASVGRVLSPTSKHQKDLVEKGPYAAVHAHTDFRRALPHWRPGSPAFRSGSAIPTTRPGSLTPVWDTWQLLAFRRLISPVLRLCALAAKMPGVFIRRKEDG